MSEEINNILEEEEEEEEVGGEKKEKWEKIKWLLFFGADTPQRPRVRQSEMNKAIGVGKIVLGDNGFVVGKRRNYTIKFSDISKVERVGIFILEIFCTDGKKYGLRPVTQNPKWVERSFSGLIPILSEEVKSLSEQKLKEKSIAA
jgi:hypothetical protein